MTQHAIDATGKKLGRLATTVATLLSGKNSPLYERHLAPKNKVTIKNVSKIDIPEKKLFQLSHTRYSGYPGGFKKNIGKKIVTKKGYRELLRHAVSRMLPKNKHRQTMLKNLTISE